MHREKKRGRERERHRERELGCTHAYTHTMSKKNTENELILVKILSEQVKS